VGETKCVRCGGTETDASRFYRCDDLWLCNVCMDAWLRGRKTMQTLEGTWITDARKELADAKAELVRLRALPLLDAAMAERIAGGIIRATRNPDTEETKALLAGLEADTVENDEELIRKFGMLILRVATRPGRRSRDNN
jgi:hypothetical protein